MIDDEAGQDEEEVDAQAAILQDGVADERTAAEIAPRHRGMHQDHGESGEAATRLKALDGRLVAVGLHHAGLVMLTHTPNPMKFLNGLCGRPDSDKPVMILVVGHPAPGATVPAVAKRKKPLERILTVFRG